MVWIKFIWMNKAEILGRDRLARISASPHRNSIQSPIHSVCPFPGYTCVSSRTSTRTEEMATWRLNSMWRHHGDSRRPNTCRVTPRPHSVGIFNGGTVPFYINEADFTARAWPCLGSLLDILRSLLPQARLWSTRDGLLSMWSDPQVHVNVCSLAFSILSKSCLHLCTVLVPLLLNSYFSCARI